jgi:hypothetical protein
MTIAFAGPGTREGIPYQCFPERDDQDQDFKEGEVEVYATHNAETRDAFRPIERSGLHGVQLAPLGKPNE